MKLYLLDYKHDNINGELDLGELSNDQKVIINKVFEFLDQHKITDRYKTLVVAEKVEKVWNVEDETHELQIT